MSPDALTKRKGLSTALVHEYRRSSIALEEFRWFATQILQGNDEPSMRLAVFDAYARFLHHVYEFYVGCIKTDPIGAGRLDHRKLDRIIQMEVEKLMRNRGARIESGTAPPWENDVSYYWEAVPPNFGQEFRRARNQVAHVLRTRSTGDPTCSVPEFYRRFNRFVLLLHEEAAWLWGVDDSAFDWDEIGRFGDALRAIPVS